MRFSKRRTNRALVIGFYHSPDIARSVLRSSGATVSAGLQRCTPRILARCASEEHGIRVGRGALSAALIGLLLGIVALLPPHVLQHPGAIANWRSSLPPALWLVDLRGGCSFRWLDMRVERGLPGEVQALDGPQ
jgi:hypothetical protein